MVPLLLPRKKVIELKPSSILEIGSGSGLVKNCLQPLVNNYTVLDINANLKPDVTGDVREFNPILEDNIDCVIVADVLEHIPFSNVTSAVKNIYP